MCGVYFYLNAASVLPFIIDYYNYLSFRDLDLYYIEMFAHYFDWNNIINR